MYKNWVNKIFSFAPFSVTAIKLLARDPLNPQFYKTIFTL